MSWCSKIGLFIFIWPIICFYFCKNVGTCYDVLQTSKIGFTLIYLLLLYRILYMICTRCNLQQARMSILLKDSSSSSAGVSKQSRSSIYILNIRSWCNLPMLAAPLSFFILIRPSSARQAQSLDPIKILGQWLVMQLDFCILSQPQCQGYKKFFPNTNFVSTEIEYYVK